MVQESPNANRPADTGTRTYDTYIVEANDTVGHYAQNLYERNPEIRAQFPQGLWGANGFVMHLVRFNNNLPVSERPAGWQRITAANGKDCDGTPERSPHLTRGRTFVYPEVTNEILDPGKPCARIEEVPNEAPAPTPPGPAPVPTAPAPAPVTQLREQGPTEFIRQDAPSMDGTNWRPGTQIHALETLARSGLNPDFTREYYALKNIAARHAVVNQRDTGEVGGNVNGNGTGDHLNEGRTILGIGEDGESRRNDGEARRRGTTGRGGVVGAALTGPRARGFVTGHIAEIGADGTYVRAERMPIELAKGGNYAYQIAGVNIPLPIPGFVPVGGLWSSPQGQTVLPAETRRWGISQPSNAHAAVNEAGYHNVFRDQQAMLGGALETPDRIYAYTHGLNANQTFIGSMRAFDETTDPTQRQALAVQALVANRDMADNLLVRRVDAFRIPIEQEREGIRNYLQSQGVDLAAADAVVSTAPRLPLRDMNQEQLERQQDYRGLANSRYAGINPGQTNAAYAATERFAYPAMNRFDQALARGEAPVANEAQVLQATREAALAIISAPTAHEVFAANLESNPNLGIQVTNLLRDMPRNAQAYGFQNAREAQAFVRSISGNDGQVRAELERRGDTAALPLIGIDKPFSGANIGVVAPVVADAIRTSPTLFNELIDRATNTEYGVDRQGRTDGRRYGVGILRSFAAERVATNAPDGTTPAAYEALATALGGVGSPAEQTVFRGALLAASVGESGASNVSNPGVQRLDNLYTAAQYGHRAANGEQVGVVGGAYAEQHREALRNQGAGENLNVFNTGAFDGSGVYDAARSGDVRGVVTGLLRTADARESGSTGVAVGGLNAYPALARDAVLLTIINEPNALNSAIRDLRTLDRSASGDKYGELAAALEGTRTAASRYKESGNAADLEAATRRFGSFFANLEASQGHRHGELRQTAWNQFVAAVGNNPDASAWVADTAVRDEQLAAGVLRAMPGIIAASDNRRLGHDSSPRGDRNTPTTAAGADVYTSRYFQLSTDDQGRTRGTGLFSHRRGAIGVDTSAIVAALAGSGVVSAEPNAGGVSPAGQTPDDIARTLAGSGITSDVNIGSALNTNPVLYTGTRGEQTPVQILAALLEQRGTPLPAGVNSFQELASTSIQQGMVDVVTSPEGVSINVNTPGINTTLQTGGNLPTGVGIAAWWLTTLIRNENKGTPDPDTIDGQVPGCSPNCHPIPPVLPTNPPVQGPTRP